MAGLGIAYARRHPPRPTPRTARIVRRPTQDFTRARAHRSRPQGRGAQGSGGRKRCAPAPRAHRGALGN